MPKIDIGDIDIKTDTYETARKVWLTGITGQPNAIYEVYTPKVLYNSNVYYGTVIITSPQATSYNGTALYKNIVQADSSGRMYIIDSAQVYEKHHGKWCTMANVGMDLYSKNNGRHPGNDKQMKEYGGYMILRLDGRTSLN